MAGGGCDAVVALLGAPNAGKTTLFNALTGAKELVANWPGATVEIRYARMRLDGKRVCLVDLPGLYSLSGTGPEEEVTRRFIFEEKPDAILVLADATNLERSLYLPLEALELYDRVIVVLTKIDEAERMGVRVDVEGLEGELGVPVVAVSALRGRGLDRLRRLILDAVEGRVRFRPRVEPPVPRQLAGLHEWLSLRLERLGVPARMARWLGLQLLTGSEWARRLLERLVGPEEAGRLWRELLSRLGGEERLAENAALVAAERYERASRLFRRYVSCPDGGGEAAIEAVRVTLLDQVFLHPVLGPIAGLGLMLLLFLASFTIASGSPVDSILDALGYHHLAELVSEYNLVSLTARLMDWLAGLAESHIPNPVLARLVGEGVLSSSYGVGLVVSFLPLVAVFMALVAVLEDSGLMPRIAAGVDKMFRVFGVSGKAIFPAFLSFGCNVPAVLSARIMDSWRERRALYYALPLLPCSARYVVIISFAYAYFHGVWAAVAAFTVYLVAIAAFLFTLWLFARRLGGGGEEAEMILELPPLKRPSLRVVWWLTWDKVKHFLVRAGTVILAASVVLWLAANYGPQGYLGAGGVEESYAAAAGRLLAPYAELITGVNESIAWRIGFGLIGGFIAKEVFLDSLAVVAPAAGQEAMEHVEVLRSYGLQPWQALALLVAVTLYVPCLATIASIYAETGSRSIPLKVTAYTLTLATIAALAVRLLGELALGM